MFSSLAMLLRLRLVDAGVRGGSMPLCVPPLRAAFEADGAALADCRVRLLDDAVPRSAAPFSALRLCAEAALAPLLLLGASLAAAAAGGVPACWRCAGGVAVAAACGDGASARAFACDVDTTGTLMSAAGRFLLERCGSGDGGAEKCTAAAAALWLWLGVPSSAASAGEAAGRAWDTSGVGAWAPRCTLRRAVDAGTALLLDPRALAGVRFGVALGLVALRDDARVALAGVLLSRALRRGVATSLLVLLAGVLV